MNSKQVHQRQNTGIRRPSSKRVKSRNANSNQMFWQVQTRKRAQSLTWILNAWSWLFLNKKQVRYIESQVTENRRIGECAGSPDSWASILVGRGEFWETDSWAHGGKYVTSAFVLKTFFGMLENDNYTKKKPPKKKKFSLLILETSNIIDQKSSTNVRFCSSRAIRHAPVSSCYYRNHIKRFDLELININLWFASKPGLDSTDFFFIPLFTGEDPYWVTSYDIKMTSLCLPVRS